MYLLRSVGTAPEGLVAREAQLLGSSAGRRECDSLAVCYTGRPEVENLLLRQLIVLRRNRPGRVRLRNFDRLLLASLYRLFPALRVYSSISYPEPLRTPTARVRRDPKDSGELAVEVG